MADPVLDHKVDLDGMVQDIAKYGDMVDDAVASDFIKAVRSKSRFSLSGSSIAMGIGVTILVFLISLPFTQKKISSSPLLFGGIFSSVIGIIVAVAFSIIKK